MATLSPERIREEYADNQKIRERDLAAKLGIAEAELIVAHCGDTVQRIDANPDVVIGAAMTLGEVMALTRNESCVHEKVGVYENYHSGHHASMVLNANIDLRIFPSHWKHAFLVEKQTDESVRKSIQVFDAAGDAVHKIYLRSNSNLASWKELQNSLRLDDQSQTLDVTKRIPPEAPRADVAKVDILRKEWTRMTDTHQFMRLTSKLKMNRLGAYRIAGEPFVRRLCKNAVDLALNHAVEQEIGIMIFTGNKGCIQIHSGPIKSLRPLGPWQNVMDPEFNLHLRLDQIAEVYTVDKPTQRGPAVSIEAFDKDGTVILQVFGIGKEGRDHRPQWQKIISALPSFELTETV